MHSAGGLRQKPKTRKEKKPVAGPVGAVEIAQRFPRACGIPQEFQAIVDPVLWDPHERQARQLPQGLAPANDYHRGSTQHVGGTHSKPGTIEIFKPALRRAIDVFDDHLQAVAVLAPRLLADRGLKLVQVLLPWPSHAPFKGNIIRIDHSVLAFTAGISLLTAIFCAMAPGSNCVWRQPATTVPRRTNARLACASGHGRINCGLYLDVPNARERVDQVFHNATSG
jgi:hypothetical protein